MTPLNPDRLTADERQNVTAGVIAICLGLAMIAYGAGWDLTLTAWVAVIAAVFGSTASAAPVDHPLNCRCKHCRS